MADGWASRLYSSPVSCQCGRVLPQLPSSWWFGLVMKRSGVLCTLKRKKTRFKSPNQAKPPVRACLISEGWTRPERIVNLEREEIPCENGLGWLDVQSLSLVIPCGQSSHLHLAGVHPAVNVAHLGNSGISLSCFRSFVVHLKIFQSGQAVYQERPA